MSDVEYRMEITKNVAAFLLAMSQYCEPANASADAST